jgi:hypothetical protein
VDNVPVSLHTCQKYLLLLPLIMAILTEVRWNLRIVLICISSIIREVEHFSMYLLVICTSSFENSLFNPCSFPDPWCRFGIAVPYRMCSWQRFFSHPVGCVLSLVTIVFAVQKLFSSMQYHLFIFSLRYWAFWVFLRKSFPASRCSNAFPIVSYHCFKVTGLMFRSLIHCELT